MGSLTDEVLVQAGQLASTLLRIAPAARQQSVELNEEKRKRVAYMQRIEELNVRVRELEQENATVKDTQEKLEEAEAAKRQLEVGNSKLQEEHHLLKVSFEIQSREKTEAQAAEKVAMDRAMVAEAQVASLQAEVERVKANPDHETQERLIDEYCQSAEFQTSLAEVSAPQWKAGYDSCLRFQQEKGVVIPEGSTIRDFFALHPSGYPDFALVDEEDEADDSFLESPVNEAPEEPSEEPRQEAPP